MSSQERKITSPLKLIKQVEKEPPIPLLWRGIKQGSFGFIYGPPKTGKTILCENLAYHIAARHTQFLGTALNISDEKVLFLSLEEYYQRRGERLKKAFKTFGNKDRKAIDKNLKVLEKYPQYLNITKAKSRQHLYTDIKKSGAQIVFIDSLSRLYMGEIENSKFAIELLKELNEIKEELGITLILIHHTPKLNGRPITIDSLAGSRILAQEAEFMIGVNKTIGKRYIKDIAYRYAPEKEKVLVFKITENLTIELIENIPEFHLLKKEDGRIDSTNRDKILEYIKRKEGPVKTAEIKEHFSKMGGTTVQESLKKLIKNGRLKKPKRGLYNIPE
ncbi:RecA-superfamily ATPase, KaiC/GvpD/RAD55 family [Fodinibius roseus]|uniref:RecA-superfamily ATPase, KaiC/GvpD/RAD55 family n=1 Tax=Fodinibius roseus TaxID=1194090 RepID=A0A1M5I8K3_9BACT|nr:AAA family ATPase [Fodinibius roseus]SHG24582.1 RecA-superfamily ATPase, KaiC/GvpD/RAD55 family [Fodinibius roseus]